MPWPYLWTGRVAGAGVPLGVLACHPVRRHVYCARCRRDTVGNVRFGAPILLSASGSVRRSARQAC